MEKSLKNKKFFALAKGLAGFASILFVMLVVFSCNNLLVRNGGSLVISTPGARSASASSYTIELTGANGTTQRKTVTSGTTVQFDDLAPGTYNIVVEGIDTNNKVVLGGSSSATVVAGETASAKVELVEGVSDFAGLQAAVTAGGTVYVLTSIDVETTLSVPSGISVTILPAYQDVTLKNTSTGNLFTFPSGSTGNLTIGGGEYTITLDGNDNSSVVISAGEGCSVHLNENSIITKSSRGVNLGGGTSGSSLSLAGGVITGNKNNGVYLGSKSQFDMSSGSITGSFTGVSVSAESQFSMTGGSISDNTGSGVLVSGEFTMTGGSITGNSSQGVAISNGGAFTMEDGSISDNTGDGVFVSGEFTMTGGSISGNTTGGVNISKDATFTMEGGSIEKNNRSGSGGGVYVNTGATFTMSGSAVVNENNDVFLSKDTTISVSGNLSGDPVARITPHSYDINTGDGVIVLSGDINIISSNFGKFTVTPESSGQKYQIVYDGVSAKLGQLM